MPLKICSLYFEGFYRENDVSAIPSGSGVYCVYACTYNPSRVTKGTLSIGSLIYIGEAQDVKGHIAKTESWPSWRKHLQAGQELCFNMAAVEPAEREMVRAALVSHHKPPENSENDGSFSFETTTFVNTSGRNDLLKSQYILQETLPQPNQMQDKEQLGQKMLKSGSSTANDNTARN